VQPGHTLILDPSRPPAVDHEKHTAIA
jgi:hypothetical protein